MKDETPKEAVPPVDHVLLTRFNLPSKGFESLVRAQDGWLRERIELFERYCLPSVQAQTNQNFHWIIYFDPESPEWLQERIRHLNRLGTFEARFRTEVSAAELIEDIQVVAGAKNQVLLTTNLDNDDGLSTDFVDRLQKAVGGRKGTAIYLASGLVKGGAAVYLRKDPRNAFCSVSASWSSPVTCWAAWHNRLGRELAVSILHGAPAWLQVVHDHNVSNRIRGRRVSPEPYAGLFPDLLDDVRVPGRSEIVLDYLIGSPARVLRDSTRAVVKALTIALLGHTGIDRIKIVLANRKSNVSRTGATPNSQPGNLLVGGAEHAGPKGSG